MSVPDFDHEFDAEAEVCYQQFKSDSTSYLMHIGGLYCEEIRRVQAEYTRIYQDSTLDYDDRWRKLYDLRKEKDLNKRLKRVIEDLLYLRAPLCAKNCMFKEERFHLFDQNIRIQKFHYEVAKLRKANPGMTEDQAIKKMKDERGFTTPGVRPAPLAQMF